MLATVSQLLQAPLHDLQIANSHFGHPIKGVPEQGGLGEHLLFYSNLFASFMSAKG